MSDGSETGKLIVLSRPKDYLAKQEAARQAEVQAVKAQKQKDRLAVAKKRTGFFESKPKAPTSASKPSQQALKPAPRPTKETKP